MRSILIPAALAASCFGLPAAHAAEPFVAYDRFAAQPLDPSRWTEGERVRAIKGGALQLMQRSWGLAGSDSGLTSANWNSAFSNPATITQIRARITVSSIETNSCPSNPSVADARARIVGGFFNVGIPQAGSQIGDAIAQVRLLRASNSADPAGVLRVQGILSICTSADCAFANTVGNVVDLGTVAVGVATTVQLQWDKAAKTFAFSRDGSAQSGTVAYSESDANPPSVLFRQLSTRMNLPNCQSAPRTGGLVDAKFDNVFVNQTALP